MAYVHFLSVIDRSRHKSTVQTTSELSNKNLDYISKELANSEQIDVLSAMQDGTKLLKLCSRRTRSHWRKFQLDETNTSIRWVSDKKDVTDTTIYIAHIVEIICHSINIVKKFKDTLPEELNNKYETLQQQQFTIRYLEPNKTHSNYMPQLSPNQSRANSSYSNMYPAAAAAAAGSHHISHQPSSSFIRTLSFKPKQTDNRLDYIEDSATESSSNKDKDNNESNNNSGSFWKNWGRSKNKEKHSKTEKKYHDKDNKTESNTNNHLQTHTDSLKIPANLLLNSRDFHIQELHLMAETGKVATIWIYGLERLIEYNQKNADLSLIPSSHFQISVKELMNYSINKRVQQDNMLDDTLIFTFKERLEEINESLYHIIEQMPSSQQILFDQDTKTNNPLIRKVRQDQNHLDWILHQISKARFDKENLKRWGYILTRIEVNLGGYQIALNNQKQIELNPSKYESRHGSHKRQRSQSSTVHSVPTFKSRQNSNSAYQRSNGLMLKNRTPKSPRNRYNDMVILQSPASSEEMPEMQKYDSV